MEVSFGTLLWMPGVPVAAIESGTAGTSAARAAAGQPGADAIIEVSDVIKVFREGDVETIALRGIDLEIARGEFVALMGRSGSGKSTLLHLLAGSDRPTAGHVIVGGVDLTRVDESERARLRGSILGIVFQSQNLVPFLDLEENTLLAATLADRPVDRSTARAGLARVGLGERAHHRPSQLSGGEQQRAALAAVLVTRPAVLLADEITGELDSANATILLDLVSEMHEAESLTIVLATHDPEVAQRADRIVELLDGRVVGDRRIR
jgi:putative ABC transport system ATP-binding protein